MPLIMALPEGVLIFVCGLFQLLPVYGYGWGSRSGWRMASWFRARFHSLIGIDQRLVAFMSAR